MPRTPVLEEGEWFRVTLGRGRGWRQQCCSCGYCHDWDFEIRNGRELWARAHVNAKATAAARRAMKKVTIINE